MEIQNAKPCAQLSTSSSLSELNADCLMHIFSFLPIKDRIRVQRVCKHWREVGSLLWYDMKRLDFYEDTWTSGREVGIVSRTIFRQVLQRCRGVLKEIDLTDTDTRMIVDEVFVALLKKYCPNIRILDLYDTKNSKIVLQYFTKYFDSIINLIFSPMEPLDYVDKDLERFFQCNRNLRSVSLNDAKLGKCLRYLPFENIEELRITGCTIEDYTLHTAVKQLPHLKKVELMHTRCQNFNDVLNAIIGKSNLKNLTIVQYQLEHLYLKTITSLRHLEILQLMGDILRDHLLISISRNCLSLTSIKLGNCAEITDASLIPVLGLPNLQYVNLSRMPRITNNSLLTKMLKLKSFKCLEIDLLQNSGLRAVIESSKNIEYIHVLHSPKVCRKILIEDAMRITENRKSNVRLELFAPVEQQPWQHRVIYVSPYLQINV